MVALAGQLFEPGYRLVDGSELNLRRLTTQTGVVVGSGGPPGLPVLTAQVTEAVGAGNAIQLPSARLGMAYTVINNTAGPLSVFASDQPNPTTGTVDVVQLAQTNTNYGYGAVAQHYIATFICYLPGVWKSFYPGATQP